MGGNGAEYFEDIDLSSDGLILYAAGSTNSFTFGDRDHIFLAMSTAGAGSLLWYRRYGSPLEDFLHGLTIDDTDRYIFMSGGTRGFYRTTAINMDIPIFKYDLE